MGVGIGLLVLSLLAIVIGSILGWVSFFRISGLERQITNLKTELQKRDTEAISSHQTSDSRPSPDENLSTPAREQAFTSQSDEVAPDSQTLPATTVAEQPRTNPVAQDSSPATKIEPRSTSPQPSLRQKTKGDLALEHLQAFWMVWVGGLSIALAGIFLVKYSIEAGLLKPEARILIALTLGVGLHVAAEWLRRKFSGAEPVFAALAGGASITLYAACIAALDLYQLVSPTTAFVGMAIVALATISLALVHGPVLAIMGILGGYAVPIFVSDGSGNIVVAMVYSLIVSLAALVFMRRIFRTWLWLGMLAGAFFWWYLSLFDSNADFFRGWYLALLSYAILAFPSGDFLLRSVNRIGVGEKTGVVKEPFGFISKNYLDPRFIGLASAVFAMAVSLFREGIGSPNSFQWMALVAVVLWATSRHQTLALLSWGLLTAHLLALFSASLLPIYFLQIQLAPINQANNALLVSYAGSMATLYCLAAFLAARIGNGSRLWYSLGFMSPILWLAYCYVEITEMKTLWLWGAGSAVLGLGYLIAANYRFLKQKEDAPSIWLIFSGSAALALGLVFCLREASLTLGVAALLFTLAWLLRRFELQDLNWLVKLILSVIIVRLTLNPWLLSYPDDSHWSLWTYGGCTILTALASLQLKKHAPLRGWVEAAAVHLLVLTVAMETRYWLYDGQVFREAYDLTEAAINTVLLSALSFCYQYRARFSERLRNWYEEMSFILLILATLSYGFALIQLNPIFGADPISSTPVFNILLLAYGLPPMIALLAMKFHRRELRPWAAWIAALGSFAFITLEIRHLWQGRLSLDDEMLSGELYTYSLIWLAAAIGLLLYSMATKVSKLYKPSMVFLGLVIAKIFILDMSDLQGLLRVASFMGLGLALLGLAFLHRSKRQAAEA